DAVSVVIADFTNLTGDATFDRTIEPMLRRALRTSSFIKAYDRSAIVGTIGVRPPDLLDETAARKLAVNQGLGIVLSGTIDQQRNGYGVSVKAQQAVTGAVVVDRKARAKTKNDVLGVANQLVADVRKALGDEVPESAQLFAMRRLSTTSLEVVPYYAAAVEAQARGKFEDAKQSYLKAVALDPKFGIGYQGLAVMSRNLGRPDDADKYIKEAIHYLDSMTERERFGTRGFQSRMIGDNQQCAREYGDSLAKFPAGSGRDLSEARHDRRRTRPIVGRVRSRRSGGVQRPLRGCGPDFRAGGSRRSGGEESRPRSDQARIERVCAADGRTAGCRGRCR